MLANTMKQLINEIGQAIYKNNTIKLFRILNTSRDAPGLELGSLTEVHQYNPNILSPLERKEKEIKLSAFCVVVFVVVAAADDVVRAPARRQTGGERNNNVR